MKIKLIIVVQRTNFMLTQRLANMLARRRADEHITLGQRIFHFVGQTCTNNHGPTLAQHRAFMLAYCWTNTVALRRADIIALRRADEQNYVGQTPFSRC